MRADANAGNLTVRAECALAWRKWGGDTLDDAPVEAVAGAILEAETAHEIHAIRIAYEKTHTDG